MIYTLVCFSQWLDEIVLRATVASHDLPFIRGLNAPLAGWHIDNVTPFLQLLDGMYNVL
jgi:hypothetical protein